MRGVCSCYTDNETGRGHDPVVRAQYCGAEPTHPMRPVWFMMAHEWSPEDFMLTRNGGWKAVDRRATEQQSLSCCLGDQSIPKTFSERTDNAFRSDACSA